MRRFLIVCGVCLVASPSWAQNAGAPQLSQPEIALPDLVQPPTIALPEVLPDAPVLSGKNDPVGEVPEPPTVYEQSRNMIQRATTVGIKFADAIKRGDRLRVRLMIGLPFLAETRMIDRMADLDRVFGPKLPPDREMPVPDDISNEILAGVMTFQANEYRAIPFLAKQAAGLQAVPTQNYDYVVTLTSDISGRYETMLVLVRRLPDQRLEVAGYVNIAN